MGGKYNRYSWSGDCMKERRERQIRQRHEWLRSIDKRSRRNARR